MARILVGVSGGIAAYKAVEFVRLAGKAGHSVRVLQTAASERFVGRATFEGITGAPVLVEEFEPDPALGAFPGDPAPDHAPISHLALVERCDAYVILPASANTIAKLAAGLGDNMLTSAALACPAPLVIAPAMNAKMYDHPATQANLSLLAERGAHLIGPEAGSLASRGEWGSGRLTEPAEVMEALDTILAGGFTPRSLDGLRVLVTAGGTREPIDAVRYVGNRSSGRMGFALASEAARRGAEVTVIAANVSLPREQDRIRYVDVETAAELGAAAAAAFQDADVLLMSAAVADFRPTRPSSEKIKKAGRDRLELDLEATDDVLLELSGSARSDQLLVGFAAEHGPHGLDHAREKLERKGLHAIVHNDVSVAGVGFDAADNEVSIVTQRGVEAVPRASKAEVAAVILDAVERLRVEAALR
ncbi:MAG: bifunctional phosphopantothenoylcysteine decarboxylase/phosphopantothenate--cysteine ligase CoaBC [Thermoleophilaceae bacterium]|nr:bifunctional phosphopantothenoylcysteine decarboxylase/phosphopantothenate--cysteine ligase CoaBC [Thermoleophilaceae bacterium]